MIVLEHSSFWHYFCVTFLHYFFIIQLYLAFYACDSFCQFLIFDLFFVANFCLFLQIFPILPVDRLKLKKTPHHTPPPEESLFYALTNFDLHQTFKISSWSSTNMLFMSKMTPSFKSPVRNPQCPPSPQLRLSQPNHVGSSSNFQDIFLTIYQHDL